MKELLRSNQYRLLHSQLLYSSCLSTAIAAVLSLVLIKLLMQYAVQIPEMYFELLYSNGYYNFGILRVANISDLHCLNISDILSSAFRGEFIPLILSVLCPAFICGSFKNGAIQSAIVRQKKKSSILISYFMTSVGLFLIIFFIYTITILVGSAVLLGSKVPQSFKLMDYIRLLMREILAHFAFLTICISISFIFRKTSISMVMLMTSVTAVPALLNTVDLLFAGRINVSTYWIVNIISRWASFTPDTQILIKGYLISFFTIFVFLTLAQITFKQSDA